MILIFHFKPLYNDLRCDLLPGPLQVQNPKNEPLELLAQLQYCEMSKIQCHDSIFCKKKSTLKQNSPTQCASFIITFYYNYYRYNKTVLIFLS